MALVVLLAGWALIAGPAAFAAPAAEGEAERAAFEGELANIDRQIWTALRGLERSAGEPVEAGALLVAEAAGSVEDLSKRLASLEAMVPEDLRLKALSLRSLLETLRHVATGEAVLPPGALRLPAGDEVTWLGAKGFAVPPNDTCDSAILVGKGSFAGDSSMATNSAAVACSASSTSPDVWFRYEGTERENVFFDTVGSAYDTVLSLHRSCPGDPPSFIACNDDGFGLQSRVLQQRSSSSGPVWIRVSGFNGASGPFVLNVGNGGAVSGRVTDAATGDPMVDFWVGARLYGDIYGPNATTDASGQYSIGGLWPEEQLFVVTGAVAGGYINEIYDDVACAPGGCDFSAATPLAILNNVTTSGIDFALDPGGRITGTVTRTDTAEPLVGVQVKAYDAQGTARGKTYTDASGVYGIGGLTTGTYFVVAGQYDPNGPGGPPAIAELYDDLVCEGEPLPAGCDVTTGAPIAVTLSETTAGIDFGLDLRGQVSGTVTEAGTGDPASGVSVGVVDVNGTWMAGGYTDATGQYESEGLEAGTYYVATSTGNRYVDELYDDVACPGGLGTGCLPGDGVQVAVGNNATTTGIDFALVPRGSITGTVTEEVSGDPLSFQPVRLWREGPQSVDMVYTDAAGAYRFDRLDPGTYFLTTADQDHLNEIYDDVPCTYGNLVDCGTSGATPIVVADGIATRGIDFALRRRGVIAGTVTAEASGLPISDVQVKVWDGVDRYARAYLRTDSAGDYSGELLPGTYFVTAGDVYSSDWIPEVYDDLKCSPDGCDPTVGTPVVVAADATSGGIDFALLHKGTLSGTVVAAVSGDPIIGARVEVYAPYMVAGVNTNSVGEYSFDGLEAGSYTVLAQGQFVGFRDEIYDDVPCTVYGPVSPCESEGGTPVVIADGIATTGVDFALDRLGAISGRVTHQSSGAPIFGVGIAAYRADGLKVKSTSTDADGQYRLQWLLPGPLYVVADKEGLFEELWQEIPCPGGFPVGCELSAGVAVPVALNGEATGIDFTLEDKGTMAGRVTDAETGSPLGGATVYVYNSDGVFAQASDVDSLGRWIASDLVEGAHFVYTSVPSSSPYVSEIYDDITCTSGCDPTKGTPIVVPRSGFVSGIDIDLQGRDYSPIVSGSVHDADSGEPISGVIIDAWRNSDVQFQSSVTSSDGAFELKFSYEETIFLSTDSGFLFVDEVYDHHPCLRGSAASGLCDPIVGDPVELMYYAPPVTIDFQLRRAALGADDFESGDLSGWSRALGVP